jgi:hypothetical protein
MHPSTFTRLGLTVLLALSLLAASFGGATPGGATPDNTREADRQPPHETETDAALALGARVLAANAGSGFFSDSGQLIGAAQSNAAALGDLDGDGDLDALFGEGLVNQVWFNDGSGTLTNSGQALGSSGALAIALGDLDGDGDLDAFFGNSYPNANTIWFNDGGVQGGTPGVFSDSGQALTSSSADVALGDLDGDGDLDAFNTEAYPGGSKVWLNDGSGVFSDSGQWLGSATTWDVALGDLDGDSDLDALIANEGPNEIWLNDGSGVFANSGQALGSQSTWAAELGDLDGDGDLDAYMVNASSQPDEVWLNDGSGNFSNSGQSLGNNSGTAVSLGDLDGDGDLDAFVGNNSGEYDQVWFNDGNGSFSDSGQTLNPDNSWQIPLGDLDGDLDAFVARCCGLANLVYLNNPPITPPATVTNASPAANSHNAAPTANVSFTADAALVPANVTPSSFVIHGSGHGWLNGSIIASGGDTTFTYDPTEDFLPGEVIQATVTSGTGAAPYVWQFRTAANGGSGIFADSGQALATVSSTGVRLGDLDGDGDLDAFVSQSGAPSQVWLNDGDGTFTNSGQSLAGANIFGVTLGDLDGDGDLDAVEPSYFSGQPNIIWFNDGGIQGGTPGIFSTSQNLGTASQVLDIDLGDLDGDGDLDAFIADNGPNQVYLNDGGIQGGSPGSFTDSGQSLGNESSKSVSLGDLDSDGDLDAFVTNQNQATRVYFNDGNGSFTDSGQALDSTYWSNVALGDLDGDGDLDAFIADNGPNQVYLNDGGIQGGSPGSFTDSGQSFTAAPNTSVSLGDLDGDGDLDAYVSVSNYQPNLVLLNDGNGFLSDSGQSLGNATTESVALGDLDGDGDLDAFDGNQATSNVWLNVATSVTAVDDSASLLQDSLASTIDVLANDIAELPLTITAITQGANGSVAITNGGADLAYTPNPGYYGSDTFTYTADNGTASSSAAVSIVVLPTVPQADLVVKRLNVTPQTVCRGQNFSLTLRPTNQGSLAASSHSVFLFNEAGPTINSNPIGQIPIGGLLAGQGKNYGLSTGSFITGTRYLIVSADAANQVAEFDELNNTAFVTITVEDDPAPQGSLLLNGGAYFANTSVITATLQARDNGNCATAVAQMRFSINGTVSAWEPYTTTRALPIPADYDGPLTIYAQFADAHHNTSAFVGATITLDRQPPTARITAPGGLVHGENVTVTWQGFDDNSGIASFDVQVNPAGLGWRDWLTQTKATTQIYAAQAGQTLCFRLRAHDQAGNASAYPDIALNCATLTTPITAGDLRPQNILLTQGIQTPSNSVPLIADRPLLVQVALEAGMPVAAVQAELHLLQDGFELPGSPLTATAAVSNTFSFVLPSAWLSGTLELYAVVDPTNAIAESDESNNRYPAQGSLPAVFGDTHTLELILVPVNWQRGGQVYRVEPTLLFEYAALLQRLFPFSRVNISLHPAYPYAADAIHWPTLLAELDALRAIEKPQPGIHQKYIALLPVPGGGAPPAGAPPGLAYQPGNSAAVYAYAGGSETLARMVAHTFGVSGNPFDACPPSADGLIGYPGWDFTRNAPIPAATPDLMTGCPGAWLSPTTYQALLLGGNTLTRQAAQRSEQPNAAQGNLLISGWLAPASSAGQAQPTGALQAAFYFNANLPAQPASPSAYKIYLINTNGQVENVRDIPLPAFNADLSVAQYPFAVNLPRPLNLGAIRLYYGEQLLSELLPGPAPVITITSPLTLTYPIHTLTWQAEHTSAFLVRYSWDGGISWLQLSPPLTATAFAIDLTTLPGNNGSGIVDVSASSGLNSTAAQQPGVRLPNSPPQAVIFTPAPGQAVYADTVVLSGAAFDREDGVLADVQMVWISDRDGVLGIGPTLTTRLSPGGHLLTLQVTDSRGLRTLVWVDFRQWRLFFPLMSR